METSEKATMSRTQQTDKQKREERIRQNIELLQNSKHYSSQQMGVIIRKSHTTYIEKRKHPDKLTIEEVFKICEHFNISPDRFLNEKLSIM